MWVKTRQRLYTLITLDNGSMQVTISKPGGHIVCIQYGGLDNLLEASNKEKNRGYWDLEWNIPGGLLITRKVIGLKTGSLPML